jgi:hypothetical protein
MSPLPMPSMTLTCFHAETQASRQRDSRDNAASRTRASDVMLNMKRTQSKRTFSLSNTTGATALSDRAHCRHVGLASSSGGGARVVDCAHK